MMERLPFSMPGLKEEEENVTCMWLRWPGTECRSRPELEAALRSSPVFVGLPRVWVRPRSVTVAKLSFDWI